MDNIAGILIESVIVSLADTLLGCSGTSSLFSSSKVEPMSARTPKEHPYGNGKILCRHGYHGEVIYDTSDPPPDHDILIADIKPSPIDDHSTCGC